MYSARELKIPVVYCIFLCRQKNNDHSYYGSVLTNKKQLPICPLAKIMSPEKCSTQPVEKTIENPQQGRLSRGFSFDS